MHFKGMVNILALCEKVWKSLAGVAFLYQGSPVIKEEDVVYPGEKHLRRAILDSLWLYSKSDKETAL